MMRIDNVRLYTGETSHTDGCVLVDGDRIAYAGDRAGCPLTFGTERLDGRGGILMPGFYNAHTHAAMTLFRGVGSDLNLMDWLNRIFPLEDRLDGMKTYWGAMLAIQEMLRRGVVAFADMYFYMDFVAQAVLETGIRANLCRGCTDISGIDSTDALFEEWNSANGPIRVYVGLHAEYTSTPEIARHAVRRAEALGTGLHVHVSETKSEVEGCMARHGVTPPRYFADLGAFENPHVIAAHCVHLNEADVALLAERGVFAVHNPASNLKLASGVAPVSDYLKAGMKVALGTDGASSNNTLDMQADMRLAALLQKGVFGDPTLLPAADAIYMATRQGALAMGFDDCGLLKKGMKADMILLDGQSENMTPIIDLPAAIVFAAQGQSVRMTMVDGRVLYMDGRFLTLNPERVVTRARETAEEILGSVSK